MQHAIVCSFKLLLFRERHVRIFRSERLETHFCFTLRASNQRKNDEISNCFSAGEILIVSFNRLTAWKVNLGTEKPARSVMFCFCVREMLALHLALYLLSACLHGGGGPQVGEVTCLGGVKQ